MRDAITSRKNTLAQRARAVRDGRDAGAVFVEGVRLCEDALRASVEFELALYTQTLADDGRGDGGAEGGVAGKNSPQRHEVHTEGHRERQRVFKSPAFSVALCVTSVPLW